MSIFVTIIFLVLVTVASCEDFNLIILHNNDMHGRFEETSLNSATCKRNSKCVGGFARTAHEIRRFRKLADEGKGPPVIYLNAGDTYVGSTWFSVFKWEICVKFINALEPDVISLGNHEFDNGISGLTPFLDRLNCPVVAANLDFSNEPTISTVRKSVIIEKNGREIGIVGHLTQETERISSPGATIFLDEVESVRKECDYLNNKGVNIIIVLGHSGYMIDQRIAAEIPLVDVVVGGHTNTFLWNGPQPSLEQVEDPYPKIVVQKSGKKVPVVQAYAYTKYLGKLNVTFDDAGELTHFAGQPILLDSSIPQEQDFLDLLEVFRPNVTALNKQVVGKSKVLLDGAAQSCRVTECNFGNLIADAFVYYVASVYGGKYWTNAPIALLNGGAIRTTINPLSSSNNITRGELLGAIPFDSQVVTLTLTGRDLIKTLELGIRNDGETSSGEFLQVSGLKVLYDRSKPAMSRVVSVQARCGDCEIPKYENVVLDKNYTVVAPSFLTDGGDGHYVLKENGLNKVIQDLNDINTVAWYIEKQSPVYPEIQGRIQFVQHDTENNGNHSKLNILMSVWLLLLVKIFSW